jgi:hypothetical protein
VTWDGSLFLSGHFCSKSLVPEVLSNLATVGVGKAQSAGDQAQGVWDDLKGSRLNCRLLGGKQWCIPELGKSGTMLAYCGCLADICQLSVTETSSCLLQSPCGALVSFL